MPRKGLRERKREVRAGRRPVYTLKLPPSLTLGMIQEAADIESVRVGYEIRPSSLAATLVAAGVMRILAKPVDAGNTA